MFENDYLMRMFLQLGYILRKSWLGRFDDSFEELEEIEHAIGDAVDMDHKLMFSLTPESVVSMLQIGSFDPELGGYIVRALFYEADLLDKLGRLGTADLRRAQAKAIAEAYSIDVSIADASPEALEEYFNQLEEPS